jgi:hypothetical protein
MNISENITWESTRKCCYYLMVRVSA